MNYTTRYFFAQQRFFFRVCLKVADKQDSIDMINRPDGMDVKTLSTILGHTSGNTTLNIYAHATDAMRKIAAEKIDRGIAKAEPRQEPERATEQFPAFQPTKGRS